MWEIHFSADPEPHERNDPQYSRARRNPARSARYSRNRRGGFAAASRDGVSTAESISQIYLRKCGLRLAGEWIQRTPRRSCREKFAPRCPLGGSKGLSQEIGIRALGWAAAAPLHRAGS